jgi:hypothetical protein
MKLITEEKEMVGKVIKNIADITFEYSYNEGIGIVFDDGTYCTVAVEFFGSETHIIIFTNDEMENVAKLNLGVISKKEYEQLEENKKKQRENRKKEREREEYMRLKAKFEKGDQWNTE